MIKGQLLSGFEIVSIEDLPEMKATGIFARHLVTGLEVYHVLNDDEENLFAYAFMTPPEDSTGVAHILEHSVLCGSKNYPLKDPFMVLAKQSVKTFLNAMTFPDKTVYPASSMVRKDYFNLMSVYGDAVFFPLLEPWVFKQEGHRFEFNEKGEVSIQGIVFNEMRGNYSSFDSVAGDWSLRSLLSGTAYEHDSGGDPADIPALTYEQFRDFHARYYHPVNCKVFLSGNIPLEDQLELLQTQFLSHFSSAPKPEIMDSVTPMTEPISLEVPAPAGETKDLSKVTLMLNWLLSDSTDTIALMEANLISQILLGHDGAPLSRALLDSEFGEDLSPTMGLETEIRHMCFTAGLRGASRDKTDAFESLVFNTIRDLVENGIPPQDLEIAIRSIDFSNREIRRSSAPFSLILMRRALRGWIYGFGPSHTLRYVPAFEEVKQRIASNPRHIEDLMRKWFLENSHRTLVTVYPDASYEKKLDDQLASRVRLFEAKLTPERKEVFLSEQKDFFENQKKEDKKEDLDLIPHLRLADLPVLPDAIKTDIQMSGAVPILLHEQPTNGIAYVDIAIPVDLLNASEYPLLPFFTSILVSMGLPDMEWPEVSAVSARLTGGFGSMLFSSSAVPGTILPAPLTQDCAGRDFLMLRMKMLEELVDETLPFVFRFLHEADFSDTKRLTDLLFEYRNDLDSSLAPAGNQYAVSRAASCTGRSKTVDEIWNGISQIKYVREISSSIKNVQEREKLVLRLNAIRKTLLSSGMIINVTGTESILTSVMKTLSPLTAPFIAPSNVKERLTASSLYSLVSDNNSSAAELITASLQVGFAAAVLPSSSYGTDEQPVETVFAHWLASGLLWEKIRTTGGAYGAFSYPDSLENIFILATYRDPSPLKSINVFKESLEIAAQTFIEPDLLEKIITGCYSREVQPRSPSDKGFTAFIRLLYGITDESRHKKIAQILSVTPLAMQQTASRLLSNWSSVRVAVLAGKKMTEEESLVDFSGKVSINAI